MPYIGHSNGGNGGNGGTRKGVIAATNGNKLKPVYEQTASVGYVAAGSDSTQILSINKSASSSAIKTSDPRAVVVKNEGTIPMVVMFGYQSYVDYEGDKAWKVAGHNSPTGDTAVSGVLYVHVLLQPGEEMQPPMRGIISVSSSAAAGAASAPNTDVFGDQSLHALEGTVVDFTAPNAAAYTDSGANLAASVDSPDTTITVTDGDYFRVNDLIQLGDDSGTSTKVEIMKVTAISSVTLTVERGLYGSNINDKDVQTDGTDGAVSGANVYLPFFNTYTDYDDPLKLATDANGRWWSMNLLGYGRATADGTSFGIQPGSCVLRFYSGGYQECGLSGVTSSTQTGLTASTEYKIDITVDGGTLFQDLTFTTDSDNSRFGGTNGLISKIQSAFDTQYYTAGNLFEKRVTVGIVSGDLRFSSGSRLSTSAILLADTGDAGSLFDASANGRIPPAADLEDPVAATLPDKTIYDPVTYAASPNINAYAYDNGMGVITGRCRGSINYETGELLLFAAPATANFEVSVIHSSPFSGKRDAGTASANLCLRPNSLIAIHANVLNKQIEGRLNIKTF
tara:strand:- start:1007 stop:2704 length:1698 start_codon:yes stop_codon:yes gene_type:complete